MQYPESTDIEGFQQDDEVCDKFTVKFETNRSEDTPDITISCPPL